MADENLIKTIDKEVEKLTKSIREGNPLHIRDARVQPDDGYDNYITIAEAQVMDAMQYEKKAAVQTLTALKRNLLDDEQSIIMSYIDKPFSMLATYLGRHGYKTVSDQRDRERNLNKMTFMSHSKTSHLKVTVWHMWCEPDAYGICRPGYVTDIDIRDLEPVEDSRYVRTDR